MKETYYAFNYNVTKLVKIYRIIASENPVAQGWSITAFKNKEMDRCFGENGPNHFDSNFWFIKDEWEYDQSEYKDDYPAIGKEFSSVYDFYDEIGYIRNSKKKLKKNKNLI